MKIKEIAEILNAKIYTKKNNLLDEEVHTGAASDLMSDILAKESSPDVLLTGLNNSQAIRTSAVAGIRVLVVVRGKPLDKNIIELAEEESIVLMSTECRLFESAGMLYEKGLGRAG